MDLLLVADIAAFCPWDEDDRAELAEIHKWVSAYARRRRVRDWARVAEVSALAVEAGLGAEEIGPDRWLDFGEHAGLSGGDLEGYSSLRWYPISVTPEQWSNGRHRGYLIQQAGAQRVAAMNPAWCDPSWREDVEGCDVDG